MSLLELADEHLGQRSASGTLAASTGGAEANPAGARIVLVDRPSAPQSELRIGHLGVPRRTRTSAISVLNAILGGVQLAPQPCHPRGEGLLLRHPQLLRHARRAGPFAVRCAVETAVTVPALTETLRIVREMTEIAPEPEELNVARDYLVGVFPLRFETSGQVAAALSGLVVFDLPDDELDHYRPSVAAVDSDAVMDAARRHIRPSELSIVLVGDAVLEGHSAPPGSAK